MRNYSNEVLALSGLHRAPVGVSESSAGTLIAARGDSAHGAQDEMARLSLRSRQRAFSSKGNLVKNYLSSVGGTVRPRPRMLSTTARRQQAYTEHHQIAPKRARRPDVALHRVFCLRKSTRWGTQRIGAWGFHTLHVGRHDSLERPAVLPCPRHCSVLFKSKGSVCSARVFCWGRRGLFSLCLLFCGVGNCVAQKSPLQTDNRGLNKNGTAQEICLFVPYGRIVPVALWENLRGIRLPAKIHAFNLRGDHVDDQW